MELTIQSIDGYGSPHSLLKAGYLDFGPHLALRDLGCAFSAKHGEKSLMD